MLTIYLNPAWKLTIPGIAQEDHMLPAITSTLGKKDKQGCCANKHHFYLNGAREGAHARAHSDT